ncbi:NAD(P)/FAD-dependent oxidoreductase [Desulfonatronum thioautotrophicum]|uniref:NAD(P)/FAD-dependent oxidoreductase n=1 Tax=Desulfonatronum thioautotrophicum TaxID=617001 RepID=UPI0005EACA7E|nr:NAD(P)/FAD-dependent oxidoreductase [Desulfonatronum thioautotrophicum]
MQDVDVLIIGQGPAGLSAAIYTARAGMRTLVLGCAPKVAGDYDIDNYFGFPETISGRDLIERGTRQAQRFGAEVLCDRVLSIHQEEKDRFHIRTEQAEYRAWAVILSTGVARVRPGIENLSEYEGKGVSYCVSCDGFFFRQKAVMVLGEGNFAANQALELLHYTPDVRICTQGKDVDMGEEFQSRLQQAGIPVIQNKIARLEGADGLAAVRYVDGGQDAVAGLFIAMGQAGTSDFAISLGLVMRKHFIEVDDHQRTNIPGLFAAGDCVGRFLQISVAVGEGALAARAAIEHVKSVRPK